MLLLLGTCSGGRRAVEGEVVKRAIGTFNSIPDPLPPGPPGSLVREERLLGAPDGAIAWRVLYRATDVHGAAVGVSGVVVAPARPAPRDGWPVGSWANPTTGAYGNCAPSVGVDPFLLIEGLHELLTRATSSPPPTTRGWGRTDRRVI